MIEEKRDDMVYVDDWIPKEDEYTVYFDNKLIVVPFDKIFNREFDDNNFCSFIINRAIYSNNIEKICNYINYFIRFYDPEKELILNYVKMKYLISDKTRNVQKKAFIKSIYELLFTESIQEKIDRMVEDNYIVNLKKDDGRKYDESMEFTNDHGKILFKVSVATNLLIPVLNQYLHNKSSDEKILYDYYVDLFDLFSPDGYNMINKLSSYTFDKVKDNYERNKVAWEQRDALGDTGYLAYVDIVLQKVVITDVLPKFKFDQNIINLLTVVLDNNLKFYNRGEYPFLPSILNDKKDMEGLSDLDKFEMSFNKIDESIIILSDCNIKTVMGKITDAANIEISDEEKEYYRLHHKKNKFQNNLVKYYYARMFNGYRDLKMTKPDDYTKLLIILKARLQAQGDVFLPQILSGNVEGRLNNRTIQNRKFITKIQSSILYKQLVEKFALVFELKGEDMVLNILSVILNTSFSYVDYNNPSKLGERIEVIPDVVSYEVLTFLNNI